MKGQDIVVLLKLFEQPDQWTVRSLAAETGVPRAGVQRSLKRLWSAGLYDPRRRRPNVSQAEEFLIHAVKYLFPPVFGGVTRGIPTAWGAAPLSDELAPNDELPPVWAHPKGRNRGVSLEPLHESVPDVAMREPTLSARLALVDAVRLGDARVRKVAADLLRGELRAK